MWSNKLNARIETIKPFGKGHSARRGPGGAVRLCFPGCPWRASAPWTTLLDSRRFADFAG